MTTKPLCSDFTPERCQYRTATGRQCALPVVDPNTAFCPRHASSQPSESEDFLAPLTHKAYRFQNAQGVNNSLAALYTLLAQGRISPRRATALGYISSLLLRTLPAIDTDLYRHAGRPGFSPNGKLTSPTQIDTPADAAEDGDDLGDAVPDASKTPKPN